jgi:phosphatidylserine decarboxylase
MKPTIRYIDRQTGKMEQEKVYGEEAIRFLYGNRFGRLVNRLVSRNSLFSSLFGWWQNGAWTQRNVEPFIRTYGMNPAEFQEDPKNFSSFNDFFIRRLKPDARPIPPNHNIAVLPADARYLFFQNIAECDGYLVKGKKFSLSSLLKDEALAAQYSRGAMAIARLCPTDYHRFHFPIDNTPGDTRLINGFLYSVNPLALKQNIHIFSENKRTLCALQTKAFGQVLFMEVGATNVGSIHQTYTPHQPCLKGDEKGYFSFGASSIILLFEQGRIAFDDDLLKASRQKIEIKGLMGQSMGILTETKK